MSSLYVPLVFRLEVRTPSDILKSFIDDSKTVAVAPSHCAVNLQFAETRLNNIKTKTYELTSTFTAQSPSPTAGERTRQRLISTSVKKRYSPPKKGTSPRNEAPSAGEMTHEPSHAYHKGRRTYSEVVVESLEGNKLFESPAASIAGSSEATVTSPPRSIQSASADPSTIDHAAYYSGNPLTEKTEGVMHFYKYNDEKLTKAAQCRMLCMFAVPAQIAVAEIVTFIGVSLPMIERLKVVRDATPNQYMLIIKFKEHNDAVTFYEEYNNCPFNDLEPHHCKLLFVDRIECTTSDELLNSSSNSTLTELPTCAVCLERMDESVLAILCNHTFHAQCLEQWADNTCPVCRYVQNPEVVAEQRCHECKQSNDLWICLICGNVGCGRYASRHAQRHWEATSHTYSLKVGGEQVWDYAGDNYVHRLIENSDGKLVELQREQNSNGDEKYNKDDKLEGIKLEYTLLLTSQLEDQRKYFEGRLSDVEQAMSKMEQIACAQVESLEQKVREQTAELKGLKGQLSDTNKVKQTAEKKVNSTTDKVSKLTVSLKDEQEINKMLRKDQIVWKEQFEKLTEINKSTKLQYEKRIDDLQSQVNDLLMHFETQTKLNEELASGNVTREEIAESQVGLNEGSSASKKYQRKKKNK